MCDVLPSWLTVMHRVHRLLHDSTFKMMDLQWTGNSAHVALEEKLPDKLLVLLYLCSLWHVAYFMTHISHSKYDTWLSTTCRSHRKSHTRVIVGVLTSFV
jgi:hypothetical protein